MADNEFVLPQIDDVLSAKPNTARGGSVRLGRHRVTVRQASYFTGKNTDKATTCVIECVVVRTAQVDHYNNLLTKAEIDAGIKPYDNDRPHDPGEVVSTVWKNEGKAKLMFGPNVSGFMTHAKHSVYNMIEAYKQLGLTEAAEETRKMYADMGLNMAEDARNNIQTDAMPIFNPKTQAFQGVDVYLVSKRIETTHNKIRMNATAYEPVSVAEYKAEIEAMLKAEKTAA